MQVEPWQQTQIPGVGDLAAAGVPAENAVRTRSIKELIDSIKGVIGFRTARVTPHRTLAIDKRKQRNDAASKGTRAGKLSIPEIADVTDHGVAQRLGTDIHAMLRKLFKNAIPASGEIPDSTRRMFLVPVIANRIVRQNVDVRGLMKFVMLARVAHAFNSWPFHVLCQAKDVRLLAGPGTALP